MTVIHPNSISGIASVTSQSNSLYFYESDHSTKLTINAHVAGNVTGDITATNGTFSGDVTIGGKLTYDDVTNIDSVGIITARSDVSIADKIIHTGDTNTAIRFPAADTVTVETSGSERLRIASDGKVGVGEDSPEALLHVGSADSWIDIGQQSGNRTKIGFNNNIAYYGNSSSAGQHVWKVNNTRAGSPWGSGNEVMRITTAGNIGIGTAAPTDHLQILHTNGKGLTFKTTENHYAQITGDSNRSSGDSHLLTFEGHWNGTPVAEIALVSGSDATNKDDGEILFRTSSQNNLNSNERLRIKSDGKVGIAQNSPETIFHIKQNDTTGPTITLENDSNKTYINNWGSSGGGTGRTNKFEINAILTSSMALAAQYISFQIGGAGDSHEKLRIKSTGVIDASMNTTAVALPTGTTVQRPSGTDAYIRKNSTNNALEFYNGTEWVEIITDYFPTGSTILG